MATDFIHIVNVAMNFIELLKSRNNRLVWGGMTALTTITDEASETIMAHLDTIKSAMKTGSVITIDKGLKYFLIFKGGTNGLL